MDNLLEKQPPNSYDLDDSASLNNYQYSGIFVFVKHF